MITRPLTFNSAFEKSQKLCSEECEKSPGLVPTHHPGMFCLIVASFLPLHPRLYTLHGLSESGVATPGGVHIPHSELSETGVATLRTRGGNTRGCIPHSELSEPGVTSNNTRGCIPHSGLTDPVLATPRGVYLTQDSQNQGKQHQGAYSPLRVHRTRTRNTMLPHSELSEPGVGVYTSLRSLRTRGSNTHNQM